MLLNYMVPSGSSWRRTSIRINKMDYKVLCYLAEKFDKSPTNYLESLRELFEKSSMSNFTAFLREHMFEELLKEREE